MCLGLVDPMANQNDKVSTMVSDGSAAEKAGLVRGATEALTFEASTQRGYRAGRNLGAFATETGVAKSLGYESQRAMRAARREDPTSVLAKLIG